MRVSSSRLYLAAGVAGFAWIAGQALASEGDGFVVDPAPARVLERAQPKTPVGAVEVAPMAKTPTPTRPEAAIKPPTLVEPVGKPPVAALADEVPAPAPTKTVADQPLDPSAGPRPGRPAPRRPTPEAYDKAVQRAQKSLAEERPNDDLLPLHPVAAANPDYNVVMCFAGCGAERERVVFFEKRFASGLTPVQSAAAVGLIKVADAPVAARPQELASAGTSTTCVAGCYANDPSAKRGRNGAAEGSVSGRIPAGTWLTTQAKADPFEGKAAPEATLKSPAAPKPKRSSSEWFTKRF